MERPMNRLTSRTTCVSVRIINGISGKRNEKDSRYYSKESDVILLLIVPPFFLKRLVFLNSSLHERPPLFSLYRKIAEMQVFSNYYFIKLFYKRICRF